MLFMNWFSTDNELYWFLGIVIIFFTFFIWNSKRLKKNRKDRKDRNFRERYMERKKEMSEDTHEK